MRSAPEGMPWKDSQLFAKYPTSAPLEGPDTLNIEALTKNLLSQDQTTQHFKPGVYKSQKNLARAQEN